MGSYHRGGTFEKWDGVADDSPANRRSRHPAGVPAIAPHAVILPTNVPSAHFFLHFFHINHQIPLDCTVSVG